MRGPLRWGWVSLIGVAMSSAFCFGEGEQWLQYRSAREISLLGSGMRFIPLPAPTADRPTGVEMPQFKAANPLFTKWQTPMVKSGFLWVALDRSSKAGSYNLLYIDSNGNGRLDDETPNAAFQVDQSSANFGPVKVVFQVEDGPVTYHLNLRYSKYRENHEFYASASGWYEGDITIGGAKKHCVLFDYTANGTFDDKSPNANACDRIAIGEKTGQDAAFVGNYLEVDGVLYEPQIARDGAFIKVNKAQDVKMGRVRMPTSITSCLFGGENGSFTVRPKDGIGSLPVGTYRTLSWTTERTDDSGAKWQVNGRNASENAAVAIAEDKETELDAGEPLVATIQATKQTGNYSFRLTTAGRAGEQIELLRNGTRPQAPKVRIKNADGTYDRTFSFEYG